MNEPVKGKPSMFDTDGTTLPPDIQEKLKLLEELKIQNAALLKGKDDLKAKLDSRSMQSSRSGVVELDDLDKDGFPLYQYTIDLPPSGGIALTISNVNYFHGQKYVIDRHQLATMLDMVHRSWKHEETIHGSNENAYRPQSGAMFNARSGVRVR